MIRMFHALILLSVMVAGLLLTGCAGPSQYASPAVQEEARPYRALYGPFGLEPGPSATDSGDE